MKRNEPQALDLPDGAAHTLKQLFITAFPSVNLPPHQLILFTIYIYYVSERKSFCFPKSQVLIYILLQSVKKQNCVMPTKYPEELAWGKYAFRSSTVTKFSDSEVKFHAYSVQFLQFQLSEENITPSRLNHFSQSFF